MPHAKHLSDSTLKSPAEQHRQAPASQPLSQPATLLQQASGTADKPTPQQVIHLQRTIGNRAVGQLLGQGMPRPGGTSAIQRAPGTLSQRKSKDHLDIGEVAPPPRQPSVTKAGVPQTVQRLVVNVGGAALNKLDWVVLSNIQWILEKEPNQRFVELAGADFSQVQTNENIYLIGHGSVGLVGSEDGTEIAEKMKSLPEGYKGQIISQNCHSGQKITDESMKKMMGGEASGLERLQQTLKEQKQGGIKIAGPKGAGYTHPISEKIRADKPERHHDFIKNVMEGKSGAMGTRDMAFPAWKKFLENKAGKTLTDDEVKDYEYPVEALPEYAAGAAAASKGAFEKLYEEGDAQGYLLPEDEGLADLST